MAQTLEELLVLINSSTDRLRAELNQGEASVKKFERNVDRRLDKVDRRFAKLGSGIRNALGAFGVGFGAVGVVQFTRSVVNAGLEMERFERALTFATGSQEDAEREMDFLRETADRLGLSFRDITKEYVALAAASKDTALEGQITRDIFVGIGEAATVLGLSAEQTAGALNAIQQIISKGRVSAEELRQQLGERLFGAFRIAARSIGVTTAELDKMLERGELAAEELLPALARELHETFGPEVAAAADSATAAFGRMETALFELKAAIAESGLIDFFADVATAAAAALNPPEGKELLAALKRSREAIGPDPSLDQRIAELEARLIRETPLVPIDVEALREAQARQIAQIRRTFAELRDEAGIIDIRGSSPDIGIAPATVRLGGKSSGAPPLSEEEVARVNESLRQLDRKSVV